MNPRPSGSSTSPHPPVRGRSPGWQTPPKSGYRGPIPRQQDDLVEKIAWLMDRSIPLGGGYSIGLDPLIGLIPGFGDAIGTAISSFLVVQAYRAGIPRPTLLRMVANVGIDAVVGAIPFLGDLFDFAFKANAKNLELYRAARAGAGDPRGDTAFLLALLAALGIALAIPIMGVIWLFQTLI